MLFVIVLLTVLYLYLSGLKRERLENQRKSKMISGEPNGSNKSSCGCPLYEDHFAIYNRMPIIE